MKLCLSQTIYLTAEYADQEQYEITKADGNVSYIP
jgi:hypothetical protein